MVPESASLITPRTQSPRAGVEPIRQLVMMENHDEAYYAWKKAGFKDRVMVHVDAHIDFGWIPERDTAELLQARSLREFEERSAKASLWNYSRRSMREVIQSGNYLNPALREGIVRSLYWVVPDGFLGIPKQRKLLEQMLNHVRKVHPQALQKITWVGRSLRAEIYGKPMTVCTLSDLPEFGESILLDIDTDFLVIETISPSYPYADLPKTRPWIWPEELVEKLRKGRLRTDFITIAYSVEGGYTPLGYKYLGDDLAMLFKDPGLAMGDRQIMALKKQAALYAEEKKIPEAIHAYESALAVKSDDASIQYALAQVLYEQGRADQARGHYEQAVALDPSYRTAYNNLGAAYFTLGRFPQSAAEYHKALTFDPDNVDAHCGLADLSVQKRLWNEAIVHYRRASELRSDDGRAHLGLGYVYVKLRSWSAAEEELKQALASEEDEGLAHYWLGYVYSRRRRWDGALAAYKAARRLGIRDIRIHLGLGKAYLRKGNFYQASRHYRKALILLPAIFLITLRRLVRQARRIVSTRGHNGQPGHTSCQG